MTPVEAFPPSQNPSPLSSRGILTNVKSVINYATCLGPPLNSFIVTFARPVVSNLPNRE